MVSIDVPLISNLNVLENIALIKEYHHHLSQSEAETLVLAYLEKMNLSGIARKRNPALTHEERFCAMALRAVMVEENIVVIDRPFTIMPDLKDSRYILSILNTVTELLHNCHIFDYIWNQDRYEEGWA
jgi:ABC-type transporter Mla maintaining outer membrane lipid asymmetry ATPase subunit MlaF